MATSRFVWGSVVISAIGIFPFGYNVGSINGVQDMEGFRAILEFDTMESEDDGRLPDDSILSNSSADFVPEGLSQCSRAEDATESNQFSQLILGLLVAIVNIGGLLGSLVAGSIADFGSRKSAIMIGGSLTTLGRTLLCTAVNVWMIIVGRFLAGIGFGLLYMVIPVYIAEISPERSRGKLSSVIGPMLAGGLLVGFVVNLGCVEFDIGWRISLGLQSIFGVLFVFGMSFLPRTPRWLLLTKKDDDAKQVITKIYPISKCNEEKNTVAYIFLEVKELIQDSNQNFSWKTQFRDLLSWRISQRVLMGIIISSLSPICGNFLLYYSVTLFCKLHILPYISTALMGVLNLGASLVTVFLIDKVGRKILLLLGSLSMFLTLLASAILIFIFRVEEGKNLVVGYSVVLLLCFFFLSFSATWLTVPWIVNSEIFPISVRGVAVSLTSGALWLAAFIPVQLFPILLASPLRTPGTLSIIAAIIMFSFIFIFLFLPETKGVSLENIDKLFMGSWSQRMKLSDLLPCKRYPKKPNER